MKKIMLLLFCFLVLLMAGCDLKTFDYIGVWVDSTTLAADLTTVSFDLTINEGTITIDKPIPGDIVITGTIEKSGSILTTTVTTISVGGVAQDPDIFLAALGLTRVNPLTYSVSGDTITIAGALITALTAGATGGPFSTLVGQRS